jgi:tRNA dimethylallyltransferase
MADKFLVVIGGPTGVGKTKVAIALAQHYQTEIVNADSRQVYKELNIGVGKPSPDQLEAVPHHLFGHISIHQPYSAGQYAKDALDVLNHVFSRKDRAILCGGTGLYLKAVMQGLDAFPDVPVQVVEQWTNRWKKEGIESLAAALHQHDPDYALTADLKNPMRLIRALSVIEVTGKPFSAFRSGISVNRHFKIIPIVLDLPRDQLYERINHRVMIMMEMGWMLEAQQLFPFRSLKALQTVGYRELFDVLEGKMNLAGALPRIQQATRNYAKRQLTWWRHQGEWLSFNANDMAGILKTIEGILRA